MVNFGFNSASLLGIFLAAAGAGLYLLRSMRPELSRDYDIFFAAVGLVCGGILLFYGWLLEPVLQIEHILLAGSTIFFAVEAIRLRGISTQQARRNTRIVDRERPVSRTRVYQEAELDGIEPYDEEPRYDNPRLRGYQDPRVATNSDYDTESPRQSRSRTRYDRYDYQEPPRKRRRPSSTSVESDRYDDWEGTTDRRQERPSYNPSRSRRRPSENSPNPSSSRTSKKRRRSRSEMEARSPRNLPPKPTDYVDYYPLENSDNPDPDRY